MSLAALQAPVWPAPSEAAQPRRERAAQPQAPAVSTAAGALAAWAGDPARSVATGALALYAQVLAASSLQAAAHRLVATLVQDGGCSWVSVGLAKPPFTTGSLCRVLRQAMFDSGVAAEQLVIELTESMLMDNVPANPAQMHELKTLGVTLSIDDFGTGCSSLSYLKRFPLDELKIDRSLVMDLPGQRADSAEQLIAMLLQRGKA